jgi:MSHA biogenesis protein MshN
MVATSGVIAVSAVPVIAQPAAVVQPLANHPPAPGLSFELSSVVLPVMPTKPLQLGISSVSPNPVMTAGLPQPLEINGTNFEPGSSITLRTSDGLAYTKRVIASQSATQLVINPNFGKASDTWTVEVVSAKGVSSGQFPFAVQAQAVESKQKVTQPVIPALAQKLELKDKLASPMPVGGKKAVVSDVGGVKSDGKPIKQISAAQQADAEFRRAAGLMQQGRIADAIAGYEGALRLDAGHEAARQALVALLLEGKRNADAEKVLVEGVTGKPEDVGFTMLLARLQVERGALDQATATLEKSLSFAETQPDYQAFLAALLQRQNRHKEAILHYQIVVQYAPNNGVWLMGYGISLQAVQRNSDAKIVFQRALESHTLTPELQAFVQQKLKNL